MASLTPEDRLRLAREMDETRLRMYRSKLLRERPDLDERELRRAVADWAGPSGGAPDAPESTRGLGSRKSNGIERAYARLAASFDSLEAPWALAGSLAVSARVEPMYMTHASVILPVKDEMVAHGLLDGLEETGYRVVSVTDQISIKDWDEEHDRPADPMHIEVEGHPNGLVAEARLVDDAGERELEVDLVFAASGIEREITAAAETLEILPGQEFPVARVGHLIALTLLAFGAGGHRPQPDHFAEMDAFSAEQAYSGIREQADLTALAGAAADEDWRLAWDAVDLMAARDATGHRDLRAELAAFLAESEA